MLYKLVALFLGFFSCLANSQALQNDGDEVRVKQQSANPRVVLKGGNASSSEQLFNLLESLRLESHAPFRKSSTISSERNTKSDDGREFKYTVDFKIEAKASSFRLDYDLGKIRLVLRGEVARELYQDLKAGGAIEENAGIGALAFQVASGATSCHRAEGTRTERKALYRCTVELRANSPTHSSEVSGKFLGRVI